MVQAVLPLYLIVDKWYLKILWQIRLLAVWSLSEAPLGKSQYIFVGFGSKAMPFSANYYLYLEVAQHL